MDGVQIFMGVMLIVFVITYDAYVRERRQYLSPFVYGFVRAGSWILIIYMIMMMTEMYLRGRGLV